MAKTHRGLNYLFDLPKDCVLDIIERCDHDDLDEFSEISRTACRLVEEARPHAMKVIASELVFRQESEEPNIFHIKMKIKHSESYTSYYVLQMTSESKGAFIKQKHDAYMERFPIRKLNFIEALDQLEIIIRRFEFKLIDILGMSIDDRLLVTLDKAIGHSFNHLNIYSCIIDRNLNQQRFISILISARPNNLNMFFDCEASFFDLEFLKNYKRMVPSPTIALSSLDQTPLLADIDFAETLAQFGTISIPRLVVNADWVLMVILERLRSRKQGQWYFQTTRNVARAEVEAALNSTLKYRPSPGAHIVEITDTSHSVLIKTQMTIDGQHRQWELSTMFQ